MRNIAMAAAASALLVSACAAPHAGGEAGVMMQRWGELNEACRGGVGGLASTVRACSERDALYPRIERLGFCFGENADYGYQQRWDRCNAVR